MKEKKSKENYNNIPIEKLWGLNYTLSEIIAGHLKAFLELMTDSEGKCKAIPGNYHHKYGDDAGTQWLNDVRKMIYAFENYSTRHLEHKNISEEELLKRIQEGKHLFIEQFDNLWY